MKKILLIIAMTAAMFASVVEDNINAPLMALKKYQEAELAGNTKVVSQLSSQYRLHLPFTPVFTKNKTTKLGQVEVISINEAAAIFISTPKQCSQKVIMVKEDGGWKVHTVIPGEWFIGSNTISPVFPTWIKESNAQTRSSK